MNISETISHFDEVSVAEVVLQNTQATRVLNKYNIDFCCGGDRSFAKACNKAGVDPQHVWNEIQETQPVAEQLRMENWSPILLADYIVGNHHSYVRQVTPELKELLDKVCSVHGEDFIEINSIREDFEDLAEELYEHMLKEEQVLFPAIKRLFDTQRVPAALNPIAANIQTPIDVMEEEHRRAGDLLKSIRKLTNNFTPPASACPTFRLTYKRLEEFEEDLMKHIHLENNILFKKAASVTA